MPEPPNLKIPGYRYDEFCEDCLYYKNGVCQKYSVPVKHYQVCDDWDRNPAIPTKFV